MKERLIHSGYFTYMERNIGRGWRQFLAAMDSVSILIYVHDLNQFVLVAQPREALIDPKTLPDGVIIECVAGRFDYKVDPLGLTINEAREEAGVTLRREDIQVLNQGIPATVSAGATNERTFLFYAVVDSSAVDLTRSDFSAEGEDERITRVMITPEQLAANGCHDLRVFALYQYHLLQQKGVATS